MVTRDFDAMLAEKAGVRPTFKIGGQIFTLRSKLPYSRWTKIIAAMRDDDVSGEQANEQFFRAVLIPSDRERFMELLNSENDDDGAVIGMQEMDELLDWAMSHFTGKAPSNSNGSSPGAGETGQRPNVISLSAKAPANAS